jgi:hypothetical protein
VADFWRRWHISFSSWILDYIFKPLQMQWRSWKNWGTTAALIVTFFVSGVWHGARWGFVMWGLLHGIYLACSVFYKPYQKKLHKVLRIEKTWFLKAWQIFVTFNLVSFAWIFFRADNIAEAFYIIRHLFAGVGLFLAGLISNIASPVALKGTLSPIFLGQYKKQFVIAIVFIIFLETVHAMQRHKKIRRLLSEKHWYMRWAIYYCLIISILLFGVFDKSVFIYFQF